MKKKILAALLSVSAISMTTAMASVAGATPSVPVAVPGAAYAVDGESHTLWAIPPGGGTPVAVADLPGCYAWGATLVGDNVYWSDSECGGIYSTSVLTGLSTEVIAPDFDGFYSAGYVAADAAGNVWATGEGSLIAEIPAATQTPVIYGTTGGAFGEEADAPVAVANGTIYIEAGSADSTIYTFADPAPGTPTDPIALQTYVTNSPGTVTAGLAADPSGNLYVSDYHNVYEISAVSQDSTLLPQSCTNSGIENITYWSGGLYFSSWLPGYVCEFNSAMTAASVYSTSSNPYADPGFNPEGFGFLAAAAVRPPIVAVVTADESVPSPLSQSITATWLGVPGALSYTCTLMYGFGAPSTFTVTTPSRTCTYTGLSPTTEYGIQVVANYSGGASAPSVGFASPPPLPSNPPPVKHTIVCEKNHKTTLKTVTAVHPTCPAGWHRVA